LLDIEVKQA